MKLLMISGDRALASGRRGAFYNTIEEMRKHFERIDIICPKAVNGGSSVDSLFNNVFVHPSPWSVIFQSFWVYKKGKELHRKEGFNVITVHDYPPFYNGFGARLLYKKIKVPYVTEIFHIPGHPKSANFKEELYKNLTNFCARYISRYSVGVRVMNKKEVPEFLAQAGVSKEKIIYSPAIYLDKEVFRPMNLEKKYDLIFVGRLEKNKGIDLLIRAFALLVNSYKLPVKCLIVGTGPLEKNLKLRVKSLNLENHVVFHGWAKDANEVARLINESRVLVMPSFNEGGPRVVVEAMACGVPVLGTPVGIVPDVVKNGESGFIIDWDPKDIADKARTILNDNTLYEKIKNNGLKIAAGFDKAETIKNYADKLKSLV